MAKANHIITKSTLNNYGIKSKDPKELEAILSFIDNYKDLTFNQITQLLVKASRQIDSVRALNRGTLTWFDLVRNHFKTYVK